ncbi:MAG: nuclear transport factor 2 family protein [Gemmatimonadaceae bacterium]
MRHFLMLLLTAACAANGLCRPAYPRHHRVNRARLDVDLAAIRSMLDAWQAAAMQAGDSAGTLAPLTKHFLLLEDTLPLSGPELVARLAKGGTDTKWSATFSDWRTRFNGDVAWTTLRNHETSEGKTWKKCRADFLETIVFVREGSRWPIDRHHAAALRPWTCGR